MNPFAPIACGLIAATLVMTADGPAGASTAPAETAAPMHLICSGGPADPVCAALAHALARHVPGRDVVVLAGPARGYGAAGLTIRFVEQLRQSDSLSGHLTWERGDGSTGSGPTMDLNVMDADLGPDALKSFAQSLFAYSNLPL